MIQDNEMREMFRVECEEHLQHLDDGLLRLEKNPEDPGLIEELFREAHSLKGASRMLGLGDIEMVAHRLEDILGLARQARITLTAETFDCMAHGLDALRRLVREATSGIPAGLVISEVLAALTRGATAPARSGKGNEPPNVPPEPATAEPLSPVAPSPVAPPPPPPSSPGAVTEGFRIDTIRVDTRKLDVVMTQLGELAVTKNRVASRRAELEEIISLWETAARESVPPRPDALQRTRPDLTLSRQRRQEAMHRLGEILTRFTRATIEDSERLDFLADALEEKIRGMRLLPVSTIFTLFERTVRDLAREQRKEAILVIEGGETAADKRIIEEMKDPLMHMIRNAIDHGIESPATREERGKERTGRITLRAAHTATHIVIEVADDGGGMDPETIRQAAAKRKLCPAEALTAMDPDRLRSLVFASGLSTSPFVSEVSGRGVGLDVVRRSVEQLKGSIQVESIPMEGSIFRVKLPITVATTRVFIMTVGDVKYALPVEHVEVSCLVDRQALFSIEERQSMFFSGQAISVVQLAELLELPPAPLGAQSASPKGRLPCVVIREGEMRLGILVDQLLDEQEIVFKPQGSVLRRVRNVSGATILGTGEVCMVLNPQDMLKSVRRRQGRHAVPVSAPEPERKKVILLAEDSITTRTQEKRILEGAGYEVVTAVDGLEAFNRLGSQVFDAVVTDILMPNMDGLTLTTRIRGDKRYRELPVILVTSLATDEDKRRGIEAGANAYLPKPSFDQTVLLDILKRLV